MSAASPSQYALFSPPPAIIKKPLFTAAQIDQMFAAFWAIYPVKRDRKNARKAFAAAIKTADLGTIIDGARRYAAFLAANPTRSPKYPQGWLNGERWEDRLDDEHGKSAAATQHAAFDRAANFFGNNSRGF